MKSRLILAICTLVVICPKSDWAQAPAPPIDRTPLARPKPICAKAEPDAAKVMRDLVSMATMAGFSPREQNTADGTLEAWKMDAPNSENSDRVVIWIERDLNRPANMIQIYLSFGRYMKIIAAACDICRVVVNDNEEQRRVGPLKQLVVNYCVS